MKAAEFGYVGVVKTLINNKHIDIYSRDDVSNDIHTYLHMYHHICKYDKTLRTNKFIDANDSALIVILHSYCKSKEVC